MNNEERGRLMSEVVQQIMDALAKTKPTSGGGTMLDGQLMIESFHFITAAMIEAHPEARTRQELEGAAEAQKAALLDMILRFRQAYEATGVHPWHKMNEPPTLQ